MIGLSNFIAMLAIIYLVKVFIYPYVRSASLSHKKRMRIYIKNRKQAVAKEKYTVWKRKFAQRYIANLISNSERNRLKKIIERLDLAIKPEEIRFDQFMFLMIALIATLIMLKVNILLGCTTGIFIVLGWLYPVNELEKKIEKKNKNIARDFPSFYSMVYYQYSKSVNIHMSDVIKDYLPNANPDIAEELGVMLDNMDYGEEYALKQFKKRVPIHYIIKFCDIMETRLKGYDNVSQMTYLKNDIDQFRIRSLEEELQSRQRSGAKAQFFLLVVLGIYIFIYYLFTIIDSIKMFQ